ncbi:Pr6Pr family membrane protein [Altererythrobacter litoralis]|uniref:Pr6Pr family membrane protein n=1 Tax=Altererythrobacter litoralis TaxID=3113904 RepID=A0ABU7GG05_9SPHN|nr:Pr6Pr family membrane protein [Erythrobacteraceae bacterium 1XM1-14]
MDQPMPSIARACAGAIALLALCAIALQTTINLEQDGLPLAAFALLLRYFTIWSNLAAGLILLGVALGGQPGERVLFALATALSVVALVYHALLAADHHPVGLDWWTNLAFHTIIPAAAIAWWIAWSDRAHLTWRSLALVTPVPVGYTAFALVYGAASGFYPYFFLDLPALGWTQLLINLVGLGLFFMAMGALLLGLRRLTPAARA